MVLFCSKPLWSDGHLSDCVVRIYLNEIFPLTSCLISTVVIWISYIFIDRGHLGSRYHRLQAAAGRDVELRNQSRTYITLLSPLFGKIELVSIVANITWNIFLLPGTGRLYFFSTIFSYTISPAYLLILFLLRQKIITRLSINLQRHSVTLYTIQCINLAVTLHAQILLKAGQPVLITTLIRFTTFTVLCLLHWTSPRVLMQRKKDGVLFISSLGRDVSASLLSHLTFSWINGLLWNALWTTIQPCDLYPLDQRNTSKTVGRKFNASPSTLTPIWVRLWRFSKYDILKQGGWACTSAIAVLIPPLLIRLILQFLVNPEAMSSKNSWLCAGGLLLAGIMAGTADCHCEWAGHQISARVRAVLINQIYNKILRKRILPSEQGEKFGSHAAENTSNTNDGGIINLMSVDVEHVTQACGNLYMIWVTFPVQTALGTWSLYKILGVSGVFGVLVMIMLLPLNVMVAHRVMAAQARVLSASDIRLHTTNDFLKNMKTIKYSGWESAFKIRVLAMRKHELKELWSRCLWWSISMITFNSLPFVVTMVTCFFYTIVYEKPMVTSTAFPALTIFTILRIPLDRMATSISFLIRARVSLSRIEGFLQERETGEYRQEFRRKGSDHLGFDQATLAWPTEALPAETLCNDANSNIAMLDMPNKRPFRLKDLTIDFKNDKLNVVCGPSGAGKTSLLLALLGEMDLIAGHAFLPHDMNDWKKADLNQLIETTAYCPQEPWILNRTIRSNILLDLPFDNLRYEAVLRAVALISDIAALDHGDQTMAGENGSRLSGGQKQRVSLARALYSPSKYVLLDDCLSALDSRTAKHVLFHAIKGPIMKQRTCIIATHNTKLIIPHSDFVVLIDDGRVIRQGKTEKLISMGLVVGDIMTDEINPKGNEPFSENEWAISLCCDSGHEIDSGTSDVDSIQDQDRSPPMMDESHTGPGYIEGKPEGQVKWSILRSYFNSMGPSRYWFVVLSVFGIQQVLSLGTSLWIKQWAFHYDPIETPASSMVLDAREVNAWYYIMVYAAICTTYVLITLFRDLVTFYGSLKASSKIYNRMLNAILYAKISFFDSVPRGQIINRLTKDVEIMDQSLPGYSISAFQTFASIFMVFVLISTVLPQFLFVAVVICVLFFFVAALYINGARDLRRIESVQRSPIYQQFGETLNGRVTIRAYAKTSFFTAQNWMLVDQVNQSYLLQWASQAWLTFRVEILSSLVCFFTGAFVLWNSNTINPGSAGLVLTYATTFSETVIWFIRVYTIIQQDFNSVERISEYIEIEQEMEVSPHKTLYDLPQDWPSQGGLRFNRYSTRYAQDLQRTLNEVNFEVLPGQRVAIVGRTGAGKSTLVLALVRGLEATSGRIEIDGVDIASVPLQRIRQVVTVVPQDPELFDGTIRDNIDPLSQHSEEDMVSILQSVRLTEDIENITRADFVTRGLFHSASNLLDKQANSLSCGQRQLLCIARALLRKTRILVLDEATASIDHQTDSKIQAALRAGVARGTTVLTIAHRLLTIADYDRVIVLDAGCVVEHGSVRELISRRGDDAIFRRLCEESGDLEGIEKFREQI